MPTFDTRGPISATVELGVGDLRIAAGERNETYVEVRPSDDADKSDVAAAQQTRVEYAAGQLLIKAPKGWRQWTPRGGGESIDVHIELPAGSQVRAEVAVAAIHCSGRLGDCHLTTGVGEIHVEHAGGPVACKTGAGDITVGEAMGQTDITTGSGAIRVDRVDGAAVVKNSSGDTWIGEVTGDLRVNSGHGRIVVDQAHAAVAAKSGKGDLRLNAVGRGPVVAETGFGTVDIGVPDGVAAWLDLSTGFGKVHSDLDAAERPPAGQQALDVRARSSFGDITIRRVGSPRPSRQGQP